MDKEKSGNQKQELEVVAILFDRSGKYMQRFEICSGLFELDTFELSDGYSTVRLNKFYAYCNLG